MSEPTYKIIRFYRDETHPENGKVVNTGFTLAQAKRHCQDPASRKDGPQGNVWFDGFTQEMETSS